ncbi:MAG TPA: hypothetical protein VG387_21600 [Rhizomicrobium sp.]|jgi:hypothetical protein|nr:hypothetical protein [Rhizomicrobium sp.]
MPYRALLGLLSLLIATAAQAADIGTRFKVEPASSIVVETVLRWSDGQQHALITFKSPADAARLARAGLVARLFVAGADGRPISDRHAQGANDPCDWYLSYVFTLDPNGRPLDFGPIDRQWLTPAGSRFATGHFVLVFHYRQDVADDNDMFGLNHADTGAFFGLDKPGNAIAIAVTATPATDQSNAYAEAAARQEAAYAYIAAHAQPRCHSLGPLAPPSLVADAGAPALCGGGADPMPRASHAGIVQLDQDAAVLF